MPTVAQLIAECRAKGIVYSGKRKAELEAALHAFDKSKTTKRRRAGVRGGDESYDDPYAEIAARARKHGTGWNGAGIPPMKKTTETAYPDYSDVANRKRGGTGWNGAGAPKSARKAARKDEEDDDLFQTQEASKPSGFKGRGAPKMRIYFKPQRHLCRQDTRVEVLRPLQLLV